MTIKNFAAFFKNNKKGMIFHENCLLADNPHQIPYLIFYRKLGKMMSQNLLSAAVMISLRVNTLTELNEMIAHVK